MSSPALHERSRSAVDPLPFEMPVAHANMVLWTPTKTATDSWLAHRQSAVVGDVPLLRATAHAV